VRYLLDVNVLLALQIAAHEHHGLAEAWVETLSERDEVLLSAWVEMGFVRVALAARYLPDVPMARRVLHGFKAARAKVGFVADDRRCTHLPAWVKSHAQVGDGHLVSLATACDAILVTLDKGISGAKSIGPA